jgi:hypothetical protein
MSRADFPSQSADLELRASATVTALASPPLSDAASPVPHSAPSPLSVPSLSSLPPSPPSAIADKKGRDSVVSVAVNPWDREWPWDPAWHAVIECDGDAKDDGNGDGKDGDTKDVKSSGGDAHRHSLTLDYDETLTVDNTGALYWPTIWLQSQIDALPVVMDAASRDALDHYRKRTVDGGTVDPSRLCTAVDLCTILFGGTERVALLRDFIAWAHRRRVRLRIVSRSAVSDIMASLSAVGIDPRYFYEIHAKSRYDAGPWCYWSRRDNELHLLASEYGFSATVTSDGHRRRQDHTDKKPVLKACLEFDSDQQQQQHRWQHLGGNTDTSMRVFVDDAGYNCEDAEHLGYATVHVAGHGLSRSELDDVREILEAGCLPPRFEEARRARVVARERAKTESEARKRTQRAAQLESAPAVQLDPVPTANSAVAVRATVDGAMEELLATRQRAVAEVRQEMERRKRERAALAVETRISVVAASGSAVNGTQ